MFFIRTGREKAAAAAAAAKWWRSPEDRASQVALLVVLGVARLEEGGVVAGLHAVPLQLVPPVLLAVDGHRSAVLAAAGGGGREAPEAPAASDVDGLEVGSVHLGLAYQLQTGEVMQVQVLEITEFQHAFCFTRGCYLLLKLLIHGEDLPEITAAEYVDGLQNVGQGLVR